VVKLSNLSPGKKTNSILHVISGDLWAGAEVQVFESLKEIKNKANFNVEVVVFNDGILFQELKQVGYDPFLIQESQKSGFQMIKEMTSIIKKIRPEIIHVHAYKEHIFGQMAVYLAKISCKLVRTFHGMSEVPKLISFKKKVKSTFIHQIERYLLSRSENYIIAVSEDLKKYLTSAYPKAKITRIYNGISVEKKKVISKNSVRSKYNVAKDVFWIGTLARLAEPKNLEMLFYVGKELKSKNIKFVISIFGIGPLENILRQKIHEEELQGYVRMEGFIQNVTPVLKSFDLFVLSSIHEGLPISLLEAVSLEIPVVCTDVGGIREVISDQNSGLLVPSNSVGDFVDAILTLYNDKKLAVNFAKNAKINFEKIFAIEKTNSELLKFYTSLIKK
jgi:glycosyltransferase involved in cell wall biosynthesis